ncbi:MAG: VWA domain-containing protein [Bacilli bacterium]
MKKEFTELVFILDESGSMSDLRQETIDGFNSLIKKQKNEEGEAIVTTVMFSDNSRTIHNRVNIKKIHELTKEDYEPFGSTALLDAIGSTTTYIERKQAKDEQSKTITKTLLVIITDGQENSSYKFNYKTVRKIIERLRKNKKWEVIFIGANIDTIAEASKLGINKDLAVNYKNNKDGVKANYVCLCEAVSEIRKNKTLTKDWKKDIEETNNEK